MALTDKRMDKPQNPKNIPIYVDLDGTLIRTDTLYESLIGLLKKAPFFLFCIPFWLFKGRAFVKARLAEKFVPAPELLPYHEVFLAYLKKKKEDGHLLVLATAANLKVAERVANYLQIFDDVLASDEKRNLSGSNKLTAIQEHCSNKPFIYAGNSTADIPIWQRASDCLVVGNLGDSSSVLARNGLNVSEYFTTQESRLKGFCKTIRPHQWSKNLLLFVSIVLAQMAGELSLFLNVVIAFASFSACAAGVYLINDLLDLEADRRHPRKRNRPLAAGNFPVLYGISLIPLFLFLAILFSLKLSTEFRSVLAAYFLITLAYSFFLKKIVILDVVMLSILYTLRIVAGSAAIGITTTPWLLGFSMFIFLSLAFGKRYSELHNMVSSPDGVNQLPRRGYKVDDIEQLAIFGSASGYIAVLVLALYLNSDEITTLYTNIQYMWIVCPLLIYWVSRFWLLARRGEIHEDPVVFTLHDRVSYLVGLMVVIVLLLAIS